MSKAIRKVLMLTLTLAMAICMVVAGATSVFATDGALSKQVADVTLTMGSGAEVRIIGQDDKDNGLRFSATISAEDYEGLKANADYQKVTFGIVIVPAEWTEIYELTEENLFGTDAKYCWDGAQAGKAEIINLEANSLTKNADGNYFLKGSIVGLQDYNIGRAFTARAYAKAVDADGNASYKMANWFDGNKANNVRSMTEVALAAIADTSEDAISPEEKAVLKSIYVAKSVPVNYYFETAESSGEYDLGATTYVSGSNGQTVSVPTNVPVPEGYIVDLSATGTVLSTTVDTAAESNAPLAVYLEKVTDKVTVSTDYTADSYRDTGLYLGLPEGAEDGDTYNVTFKIKTDYDAAAKGTQFMCIGEAGTVATSEMNGNWVEVTFNNVIIKSGQAFINKCVDTFGLADCRYIAEDVNAEDLGVFVMTYIQAVGGTVAVKDVEFELVKKAVKAPADADYYVIGQSGNTGSAIQIATLEGVEPGTKYNVTFKVKLNFDPMAGNGFYMYMLTEIPPTQHAGGTTNIDKTAFIGADSDWVTITIYGAIASTGSQFSLRYTGLVGWNVDPYIADINAVGFYVFNYGVGNDGCVAIKDVTFEKAPLSVTSTNYNGYSAILIDTPEGATAWTGNEGKYNVSFKLRLVGTANGAYGTYIRAYKDTLALGPDLITKTTGEWLDVSFSGVICLSGAQVKDWVSSLGPVNNAASINDSTVGIYILGFWVDAGTTIEIKDVVVTPA